MKKRHTSPKKPRKNTDWFVYILECADRSLYTGITLDLERRILEHSQGHGSRYVRSKLPVKLVHKESCPTRSKALKREAHIKSLSRPEKLKLFS